MNFLVTIALLPAVLLTIYIYKKDRVEREPVRLIVRLLVMGAISCIPASAMELAITKGITLLDLENPYFSAFLEAFAVAALCEELVKYYFLRRTTWNNAAFDFQFDAIVYGVSVSLGFAALENVLYVTQSGVETGILRAVTSVPGHAIFGVFMGYFYGYAKLAELQGRASEAREYLALSVLVPLLLHGTYDFIAFSMQISELWTVVFFAFVALLYLIGLRRVNRSAQEDRRIAAANVTNPVADWYEQFRQQ